MKFYGAQSQFEISQYWHEENSQSGLNTLASYPDNPPNRILEEDIFIRGPWTPSSTVIEADFGPYVIGNDATRIKIRQDVEAAWYELKWCNTQDKIIASELYHRCKSKAIEYGWTFQVILQVISLENIHMNNPRILLAGTGHSPFNHADIFRLDKSGNPRHWILELQFVESASEDWCLF